MTKLGPVRYFECAWFSKAVPAFKIYLLIVDHAVLRAHRYVTINAFKSYSPAKFIFYRDKVGE